MIFMCIITKYSQREWISKQIHIVSRVKLYFETKVSPQRVIGRHSAPPAPHLKKRSYLTAVVSVLKARLLVVFSFTHLRSCVLKAYIAVDKS